MRGRDHGLPSYRTWQGFCERLFPGIKASFQHNDTEQKLMELYGAEGFANGIDLWVGGLAEKKLPTAQVGSTFACILGITFSRLRDRDRFWYENHFVYTPGQHFQIKRTSLPRFSAPMPMTFLRFMISALFSKYVGGERMHCSSIPRINLWWGRDPKWSTISTIIMANTISAV